MSPGNDTEYHEEAAPGDANYTAPMDFNTYFPLSIEYRVLVLLKIYIQPVLLGLGTFSNITALVVLLRRHSSHSSIYWYMTALTVVNTVILYAGCGLDWYSYITETTQLIMTADWVCRVWHVIFNVVRYSSTWLVVAMVTDRFLVMWYPRHGHTMSSVFIAKVMTTFIFIALLVVWVHAMWTFELSEQNGCGYDPKQKDFETTIWPLISATVSSYLPSLALTIFLSVLVVGRCILPSGTESGSHGNDSFTCLTICLSLLFLLCSLPTIVLNFVAFSKPTWLYSRDPELYQTQARFYLALSVCHLAECFYTSSSCILYFLFLPSMRCSIRTLCCKSACRARRSGTGSNHELQSLAAGDAKGALLVKTEDNGICIEGATCL